MNISTSGITLASVALVALIGGATGAALVGTGPGSVPPDEPRLAELHERSASSADLIGDADPAPATPAPSPAAITTPVLEPEAPAPAPVRAPETAPAPATVEPVADDSGKNEKPVLRPTPAPTPVPLVTPRPGQTGKPADPTPTPEPTCTDGDTQEFTDNRTQREPGWTPGVRTCVNGKWVRTSEPQPPADSAPVQ